VHFINTTPVIWGCGKIDRTSPHSNAAEMTAAAHIVHDAVWMRSLLIEMRQWDPDHRAPFWSDNAGVVGIGQDEIGMTHRNKWMRIDDFHFRDFHRCGDIYIDRIGTHYNPADYFTKPLGPKKLAEAVPILTGAATALTPELARCLFSPRKPQLLLPT
jgi:hypothetical protein